MIDLSLLPPLLTIPWLPVWLFALFGGISAAFVRVADIDRRLNQPFFAKIFIGTAAGLALASHINGETTPPPMQIVAIAFTGGLFSAPLLSGLLAYISDQERQNTLFDKAKDKLLPWAHHPPPKSRKVKKEVRDDG